MTAVEHVARREMCGRRAQVFQAQPGVAAATQRDCRLVRPLFSARVAKHDQCPFNRAAAVYGSGGPSRETDTQGRRPSRRSHTPLALRAVLFLPSAGVPSVRLPSGRSGALSCPGPSAGNAEMSARWGANRCSYPYARGRAGRTLVGIDPIRKEADMPTGVFPVPKLRRTHSNRVRTRPGLAVRVRPAGGAPASMRDSLAAPPQPRAPRSACGPHNSAGSSSAPGSPPERLVVTPTTAETGDTTPSPSIAEQLERQSFLPIESTIPTDMTVEQWRRRRSARPRPARRRSARLFVAARRLVPLRRMPCDHLRTNGQSR